MVALIVPFCLLREGAQYQAARPVVNKCMSQDSPSDHQAPRCRWPHRPAAKSAWLWAMIDPHQREQLTAYDSLKPLRSRCCNNGR